MTTAIERFTSQPLEHRGERVVTLPMMDEAHERPSGTARRNFNEHRERMVEGWHYHEVDRAADEIRTRSNEPPGKSILLTERGYLLLVKSFRDDLAWHVQEQLVDGYFRARATPVMSAEVMAATMAAFIPAIAKAVANAIIEQRAALAPAAAVPPWKAKVVTQTITEAARARAVGSADPKRVSRERSSIDLELRVRLGFPKVAGNSWRNFPTSKLCELDSAIEGLRRGIQRAHSEPTQLQLLPHPS